VAESVTVRQHARETIKLALHKGWQVHVLSVNWSATLICTVLTGIPCRIDRKDTADSLSIDQSDQPVVVIHANTLEMQLGISTGVPTALSPLRPLDACARSRRGLLSPCLRTCHACMRSHPSWPHARPFCCLLLHCKQGYCPGNCHAQRQDWASAHPTRVPRGPSRALRPLTNSSLGHSSPGTRLPSA
jgi:hypothetical protein